MTTGSWSFVSPGFSFSGFGGDAIDFVAEIEINGSTRREQHHLPYIVALSEFASLIQEAVHKSVPIRVKFSTYNEAWSQIDGETKRLENSVEFRNNAYENRKQAT